jgi:hypothetical protein
MIAIMWQFDVSAVAALEELNRRVLPTPQHIIRHPCHHLAQDV